MSTLFGSREQRRESRVSRWRIFCRARQVGAIAAVVILVGTSVAAHAQRTETIPRIGYLSTSSIEADRSWMVSFRQKLRELGYVEGESIVIEQRHAAQRSERLPDLAAELVRLDVKAIVAFGPPAVRAARAATSTIPIVFTVSSDPVEAGYVSSLTRPGGNVTGLSDFHADTVAKRLELVREIAPAASRIAVLANPANPTATRQFESLRGAATTLRIAVLPVEVRGPAEIERAFIEMRKERIDGLVIVPDPSWFVGHEKRIADLALKYRLPAITTVRTWVDAGGLISYGSDFHDAWRRAATYVDKILKGASPADLPVERATKFELAINLATAKSLGLAIPSSLLLRADHVVH